MPSRRSAGFNRAIASQFTSTASSTPFARCTASAARSAAELGLVGGEPEIAGRHVAAVAARLVANRRSFSRASSDSRTSIARRELHAKAAGRAPGAARARVRRTVDHDDVAHAARGEMVRDARADHAPADDDDRCRLLHRRMPAARITPSGTFAR